MTMNHFQKLDSAHERAHVFTASREHTSSSTQLDRAKFIDPNRHTADQFHRGAEVERGGMENELFNNLIWLETGSFQVECLPKPPAHLMLSPGKLKGMQKELQDMVDNLAQNAFGFGKKEDVMAKTFVSDLVYISSNAR